MVAPAQQTAFAKQAKPDAKRGRKPKATSYTKSKSFKRRKSLKDNGNWTTKKRTKKQSKKQRSKEKKNGRQIVMAERIEDQEEEAKPRRKAKATKPRSSSSTDLPTGKRTTAKAKPKDQPPAAPKAKAKHAKPSKPSTRSAPALSKGRPSKVKQTKVIYPATKEGGKPQWTYFVLPEQYYGCRTCRFIYNGCRLCRKDTYAGKRAADMRQEQEEMVQAAAEDPMDNSKDVD